MEEQPLQILLHALFNQTFALPESDHESVLFRYLDDLDSEIDVFSAWQHPSLYEILNQGKADTDSDLFQGLFRRNRTAMHRALDITNFTPASDEKLHLPPVRIPLIPIAYRFSKGQKTADEATVVSWIPGLAEAIKQPYWLILNRFFGARKIHCLWCDPEPIRAFLRRYIDRVMITPRLPENEVAISKDYVNGVGTPWINLENLTLPDDLLGKFAATSLRAVPVYWSKSLATLAVQDRFPADELNYITQLYKHQIVFTHVEASADQIQKWHAYLANRKFNIPSLASQLKPTIDHAAIYIKKVQQVDLDRLNRQVFEKKISTENVVDLILTRGIDLDVSDIKIRSEYEKGLFVHYKCDGYWIKPFGLRWDIANLIISVLKSKARLRTERVDIPQDGQFQIGHNGENYLFRIHTSYHVNGEQIFLRMQKGSNAIRSLVHIGMPAKYIEKVHEVMHARSGLIVFAGPSGTGKSTTIYSILNEFDPLVYNIQTAESPIEILIPHVNQVEIADEGRNTYLNWARGIVREAPDILMMGEIRDCETADALLRVVNTGHRAITTLHADSAAVVPMRCLQLGVQPYLLAATLKIAFSQDLMKMVCRHCAEDVPVPGSDRLKEMRIDPTWLADAPNLKVGRGCSHCNGTGFSGRKALFEALIVDERILKSLNDNPAPEFLKHLMKEQGEATLFEKAVREAALGVISLEEARRLAT